MGQPSAVPKSQFQRTGVTVTPVALTLERIMRERRLWPVMQSVSEWSRSLGVDRKILYAWHRQGMPIYKVGTKRRVLTEDIVRFIRINLRTVEPSK